MGKVVLRSMSFVMASPAVIKPIDKGVTSKSSKFCTCEDPSPMRMAACTAAPKSSAKGSDDVYLRHDPLNGCHLEAFHSRLHGALTNLNFVKKSFTSEKSNSPLVTSSFSLRAPVVGASLEPRRGDYGCCRCCGGKVEDNV